MKTRLIQWAAAGFVALASAGAVAGEATVTFVHPENFWDLPRYSGERDDTLKDIADHFIYLAKKLPANEELKVEVLELDLAGHLRPTMHGPVNEIRVLRGGADWPTMRIRYSLLRDGKVVASGEDRMANMDYLQRLNIYSASDPLRYEKQMMDDWFKQDFRRVAAR